ncbi:MAG: tRNA pseudouridine(38-40) synthase TruA [Clostridiales bacterium]|jgi:tRNA pseudouridine38-40 synthase|nr:tRNA pseudouridine(38-40) synthase TruA [Clostridiales bacterium]
MRRNIAIRLSYLGTAYHGWQIQKSEITVQETVKTALEKILKEPVVLTGCGRTDAGVHAEMYCADFKTNSAIPCDRLPFALNALLPGDIVATDACEVPQDFNSILSCRKKEYTYRILNSSFRNPFLKDRAYFYPSPLDITRLKKAVEKFVGTHDFAAVRSVGSNVKSTVRTVYYFDVEKNGDIISLRVCANGFLYNMARAMVGTVIYASIGKLEPEDISKILESGDRCLAGPTVPPHGLYLTKIWYDGAVGNMFK